MSRVGGRATLWVAGLVLAAFAAALVETGRRFVETRRVHRVPILMYHKIGPVDHNAWWVPTDVFEHQMRALRNQGYTSILPRDLADHRWAGKRLPRRPVLITFDDGYRDSLRRAEPILRRCGFQAVAYLITDRVADREEAPLTHEGVECLTWPEIERMRKRGTFVFGGHGHRHENLAASSDPDPVIRECYRALRAHGIHRPAGFCYPYGERAPRAVEAVRRSGFRSAVVCEDRVAVTGPDVLLFELPRVSVMGGRHAFAFEPGALEAARAGQPAAVRHEGVPIEVSPRWVRAGAGPAGGWLPPQDLGPGARLQAAPPPGPGALTRLEIWDKHRLFLLASLSAR